VTDAHGISITPRSWCGIVRDFSLLRESKIRFGTKYYLQIFRRDKLLQY
jgi:hypothetical protein